MSNKLRHYYTSDNSDLLFFTSSRDLKEPFPINKYPVFSYASKEFVVKVQVLWSEGKTRTCSDSECLYKEEIPIPEDVIYCSKCGRNVKKNLIRGTSEIFIEEMASFQIGQEDFFHLERSKLFELSKKYKNAKFTIYCLGGKYNAFFTVFLENGKFTYQRGCS